VNYRYGLENFKRLTAADVLRLGFQPQPRSGGKAAEGRRRVAPESDEGGSPGRWREFQRHTHNAERLGVRQPSGAGKNGLVARAGGVTVAAAMETLLRPMRYGLAVVKFMPMKTGNFPRNLHIKIGFDSAWITGICHSVKHFERHLWGAINRCAICSD